MLQASFQKYILKFFRAAKTSRNTLLEKESWFIFLYDSHRPDMVGIGECALLKTLSDDDRPGYEEKLAEVCQHIEEYSETPNKLSTWPSIRFGVEMALLDLNSQGSKELFLSPFTQFQEPIEINGLVWMGEKAYMFEQIKSKIHQGYTTIKLKVGAIDFEEELSLIAYIRKHFSPKEITIRLDANGAFSPDEALEKLNAFSDFHIHSIEQPILQRQWTEMGKLCEASPIDIALDEELIGVYNPKERAKLLEAIRPAYIILKPSLVGGFTATEEWIHLANTLGIQWWATSALESNIGLSAISQWTYLQDNPLPQGLGTGQLYSNNIPSPLEVKNGNIYYLSSNKWDLSPINIPL